MFKSVFAKYVTAVMSIFAIGFAILLFIATSIVNNYISRSKIREMDSTAKALQNVVSHLAVDCEPENFEACFQAAVEKPELPLSQLISALTGRDGDIAVLVADANGNVFSIAGFHLTKGQPEERFVLSEELNGAAKQGEQTVQSAQLPFLSSAIPARVEPIRNFERDYCGCIVVCVTQLDSSLMREEMIQSILSTAMLVLVAAMIAVYFISARVISPLREMSIAVDRFAKGKFDTRVSVRGNDEVARLAEAFNNMADSLDNLEKMRSSFVANVSHDLRTPMTTISGFIGEIRSGVIPPEKQDYYLGVIETEVKRLSRLVASLLDLSKIQAGERKFVMRQFDICEMGRQILLSFEQPIEQKNLQISFDCDEERMLANADQDAIYQVFYNLCHNAVKFSREGGELRIAIAETKEHKIRVSVYNEGEGIPEEDLPFVFDRFYKSDKSRGLDKSGLGLGLYISKTIIEAHGETISVRSEPNKYCTFQFSLKKAAADERE
ncbi:MAG: HAMP domain-containing histidine kinase [Ruminococcaceae bacterium]|nr:HAMP domain-containing histidine kinase [Oscillospiraceae bacterium]